MITMGLESVATVLQAYDTHLVHGLLQTPDYARALLRAVRPELLPHEIDQLVELRMRRQQILTRTDSPPPSMWSVTDEAVLRRQIGGRETMHAQLEQLIKRSALPNVTLLVMPDDLGARAGLTGPLAIFQFEASARPVVYIEGQAGNLYLEKDDDLRRCQQTMNHILAAAPGPERSLALKASASNGGTGCVEVAHLTSWTVVRDSKNPDRPAHCYRPHEWACFLDGARSGEFDRP